eukprot:gb/GECG01007130.1/.p1 GENE.gb/GECG01007130.1/~~gb/GECG01007130.1/.p1  ORF type:complete len:428 (+),score=49.86 gb/GECG01007130.1/:1-1284(+)
MANPFSNESGRPGGSPTGRRHSQGPLPRAGSGSGEETLSPKGSNHQRARSSDFARQLEAEMGGEHPDPRTSRGASRDTNVNSRGSHRVDTASSGGADSTEAGEEATPSYRIDKENFVKGNIAVMPTGVVMRGRTKAFTIVPQEIKPLSNIGRGACSYVQRALHAPSGTQLALKVISVFDQSKRHQLLREIQALYDADCSSLVKFYGAYFLEGTIQIGLEYMDGGSLGNVVKQVGKIPEAALANIAYQVVWGLAYLKHEKRLHRDIKPSNILINSKGYVKITDFGVSAELRDSIGVAGTFTGTFKYMAPERIFNQAHSFPSDIWSFGLVLVECATGEYPYKETQTHIEMAEAIVSAESPRVPAHEFSTEFQNFVSQCLKKEPSERLPAEVLLGSSWFVKHGATDIPHSVANVRAWIDHTRQRLLSSAG